METTMTKNTAINTAATGEHELNEAELNHVSGGRFGIRANGVEIQQFADGGAGPSAIDAWTTLLHQYGAA
jgi:bacteriocin-like protein